MKKKLIGILCLMLLFTLALAGCSSTTGDTETTEETEEVTIEKPVSDVTDGTALEGTWEGSESLSVEGTPATTVVLALNSDKTFDLYIEEAVDEATETGMFSGTYTYTPTTLDLTTTQIQGQVNTANYTIGADEQDPTDEDNHSYTYVLDGNHLVLTEDGSTIDLNRVLSAEQ